MGYGYGPPGYNAPQRSPRAVEHPSASTALLLGLLGTFCLGAFTGVPAILVGRSAIRATELEPHHWNGSGTAKLGIVFGWISVFETVFAVSLVITHGFVMASLGIVVGFLGLAVVALSGVNALPLGALRSARLALGVPLGAVLVASVLSWLVASGASAAVANRCESARAEYPVSLKGENFAAARTNVDAIAANCKTTTSEVLALRTDIDSKETAATNRKAQDEKDRLTNLAIKKETTAVDAFPAASKDVAASIKSAQSKAWGGKWEDAQIALNEAQARLNDFKGTSVEQSKDFVSFSNQIAQQRKTIQPKLDAIDEKNRKDAAIAAAKQEAIDEKSRQEAAVVALTAAIRGPKPQNSPWDGSIYAVERAIKDNMNDPDSYEHVGTTVPIIEGDYWTCVTTFRGKNAFGGKVRNSKKVWIQGGEAVKFGDD